MEYICGTTEFKKINTCIAMGKFDGMHLGHRFLFRELQKFMKEGFTSVIFTFDYHPYNYFSSKKIPLIYTEDEKRQLLLKDGLDVFLSYPFTKETALMHPEDFIKEVLVSKLDVRIIAVGEEFRFGRDRRGDTDMLKSYSEKYGYELVVYKKLKMNKKIISSSLIREELAAGNITYVNQLLGSPFIITGEVIHGKKLGRTLGMPTINITPDKMKLLPPNGVYFSKAMVDGILYEGISNIGIKPTVTEEIEKGVETYLFHFNEEIYGKFVTIELHEYVRKEIKFSSINELKTQIELDIRKAQKYYCSIEI